MGYLGTVGGNPPEKGFRHRTDKGVASSCRVLSRQWQNMVNDARSSLVHRPFIPPKCTPIHMHDFYTHVRSFAAKSRPQRGPDHSEEALLHGVISWYLGVLTP